jgi:hypothetical protein
MATPSAELHTRHASPPQFPAEISESTAENNTVARRYQGLLLLSGFMMKFQVIGTNSVFGIFQVRFVYQRTHAHIGFIRNFTRPKIVIFLLRGKTTQ